jgi:hypothetical protein
MVSYDQSKDVYILRGEANRKASLYQQKKIGDRPQLAGEAKEIYFNARTNDANFHGAGGGEGSFR